MTYHLAGNHHEFNIADGRLTEAGQKFKSEHRILNRSMFGPMPAEYLPNVIHADPRKTVKIWDFVKTSTGHLVSEKFKTFLEALEPNTHQFHPVELIRTKGDVLQQHYYFLPGQRIECIFPDGEPGLEIYWEYNDMFPKEKKIPSIMGAEHSSTAVVSKPSVAGKHLWVPIICGTGHFVSDEFKQKFEAAKLTGASFYDCVDDPREYDREIVLKDVLAFDRKYGLESTIFESDYV